MPSGPNPGTVPLLLGILINGVLRSSELRSRMCRLQQGLPQKGAPDSLEAGLQRVRPGCAARYPCRPHLCLQSWAAGKCSAALLEATRLQAKQTSDKRLWARPPTNNRGPPEIAVSIQDA